MSSPAAFDPLRVLKELHGAGVDFVVIGGVAARLHGSPTVTRDIDICYARDEASVGRLAALLKRLRARPRGVEDDVPLVLDARTLLAGQNFTFATAAGDLDVIARPAGVEGFAELAATAVPMKLGDFRVKVASVDALIRMKTASGRAKDSAEVEILAALREEQAGR